MADGRGRSGGENRRSAWRTSVGSGRRLPRRRRERPRQLVEPDRVEIGPVAGRPARAETAARTGGHPPPPDRCPASEGPHRLPDFRGPRGRSGTTSSDPESSRAVATARTANGSAPRTSTSRARRRQVERRPDQARRDGRRVQRIVSAGRRPASRGVRDLGERPRRQERPKQDRETAGHGSSIVSRSIVPLLSGGSRRGHRRADRAGRRP